MSLKARIQEDMKAALRAKDEARLGSIRMLLAAIQRREVDDRRALEDAEILAVAEKQIRASRDAIEQFTRGARPDLAEKEGRDIAVWAAYLPEQMGEAEVEQAIAAVIAATGAASIKDMGKVVGALKASLQGRADMARVSARVKERLAAGPGG